MTPFKSSCSIQVLSKPRNQVRTAKRSFKMGLKVVKQFFKEKSEVLEDIKQTGYWPPSDVSDPSPALDALARCGYQRLWHRGINLSAGWHIGRTALGRGLQRTHHCGRHAARRDEVTDTVTYIIACSRAEQLFPLLKTRSPDDLQQLAP